MKKLLIIILLGILIPTLSFASMPRFYEKFKALQLTMLLTMGQWKYSEEYDCKDFSQDFEEMAEMQGIDVIQINGLKDGKAHRWIAIQIEPISGEFIRPDENYEPIEIK